MEEEEEQLDYHYQQSQSPETKDPASWWFYFEKTHNKTRARCYHCEWEKDRPSGGGTSGLRYHLQHTHPELYAQKLDAEIERGKSNRSTAINTTTGTSSRNALPVKREHQFTGINGPIVKRRLLQNNNNSSKNSSLFCDGGSPDEMLARQSVNGQEELKEYLLSANNSAAVNHSQIEGHSASFTNEHHSFHGNETQMMAFEEEQEAGNYNDLVLDSKLKIAKIMYFESQTELAMAQTNESRAKEREARANERVANIRARLLQLEYQAKTRNARPSMAAPPNARQFTNNSNNE